MMGDHQVMSIADVFEYLEGENRWRSDFRMLHFDTNEYTARMSHSAAKNPKNRDKNRYIDVLPFDETRVVLQGDHDYINASNVSPAFSSQRYICAQGPLMHTSEDFWRMLWERESGVILMLNKVIENNRVKCHPYWPTGERDDEGELDDTFETEAFRVELIEKTDHEYYAVSELKVTNKLRYEDRTVYHLHYYCWPDFGVPQSPETFLKFLYVARKYYVLSVGPPIVHCSAGIGRTGTLVLVDTILKIMESERTVHIDVYSILIQMRLQRMGLVQTPDQLRFCFLAILEGSKTFDWSTFTGRQIRADLTELSDSSEGSYVQMDTDDLESDSEDADSPQDEKNEVKSVGDVPVENDEDAKGINGDVEPVVDAEQNSEVDVAGDDSIVQDTPSPASVADIDIDDINVGVIKDSSPKVDELQQNIPDIPSDPPSETRSVPAVSSETMPEEEEQEGRRACASSDAEPIPSSRDSEIRKRKAKTSELVSDMKKRLKQHDEYVEKKTYYWQTFGKPLFIGSLAAVGLSVIVYLMR